MKQINLCKNYWLIVVIFFLIAPSVHAARIFFEPQLTSYKVGDDFSMSLFIDTEGQPINAVELKVAVPKLLKIVDVSKNNSVIQLWVSEPSFSGGVVSFTGGIPGGLSTSRGLMGKIYLEAVAIGDGNIALLSDSSILLNDGQGTKLNLQTTGGPLFKVIPRPKESGAVFPEPKKTPTKEKEDLDIKNEDNKKPEKFEILIGEDPRVFNGQKFISFFSTDKDSGIDRYELKEGSEDYKVAQSPYLLTDQELKTVIRVRAYDGAENYAENVYPNLFKRIWWQLLRILRFWEWFSLN